MKKSIEIVLCIFILFGFTQCSESNQEKNLSDKFVTIEPDKRVFNLFGKDKNGYRYGIQDVITKSGSISTINWIIYSNNLYGAVISVPEEWHYEHQKDLFGYFELDTIPDNFFLWKKYKKSEHDLTVDEFATYFYEVVTSDSIEICTEPIVKKYSHKSETVGFYVNCNMQKNSISNISHSFITHDEEYIHEFSLKHKDDTKSALNEILFFTMLDGIFFNDQKVIPNIESSKIKISFGLN